MLSTLCVRATTKNQNEDAIWVQEDPNYIIGCVADGCSTGINSAFASRLLCYLFENHGWAIDLGDPLIFNIITELREIEDLLPITKMHLLATFLPFIYDKKERRLHIRPFGDGVFYVNGLEYTLEQNNEPDYIGYQVEESFAGNEMYLEKYPERIFTDVNSFTICSDGIDSFKVSQFVEGVDFSDKFKLLEAPTSGNYLERTYNILKRRKFTNSDDVSIISYVNS